MLHQRKKVQMGRHSQISRNIPQFTGLLIDREQALQAQTSSPGKWPHNQGLSRIRDRRPKDRSESGGRELCEERQGMIS